MSAQVDLFGSVAPPPRPRPSGPTLFTAVARQPKHPGPLLEGKMLGKSDRRIGMTRARHKRLLTHFDGRPE